MASSPWMPLYIADYTSATGHLGAAQHGAYLMLIMHYWRNGSLPCDDRQLARIARMTDREWKGSRDIIAAFFDPDWRHDRIDKELGKARDKATARAEAGSRGGNAKALKSKTPTVANVTVLPEQTDAVALASSSQSQSEEEDTASAASSLPRRDYDEVERRCRLAAGLENEPSPNLFDLSPIVQLLDKGADLDRDVLPVLRSRSKGRTTPRSWRFFVPAIVEAMQPHADVAKLPAPKTQADHEAAWARQIRSHRGGYWNDNWGPEPGVPGCRIPPEFIAAQIEEAA